MSGYELSVEGDGTLYQYDEDGVLRALPASRIDVSRPFFSAPGNTDADHDQGGEGELGPEWQPVGRLDVDGGEPVQLAGRVYVAPLGTPPPGPDWSEGPPLGPPIPVLRQETREDGIYVECSVGPAHPAYAALHRFADLHVSVDTGGPDGPADKEYYVASRRAGTSDHVASRPAGLPSPTVTPPGLGREHIARRAHVPPPKSIGLGDVVAGLFGAELTGDDEQPVREITTVVPNRADRRRAAKGRRRG